MKFTRRKMLSMLGVASAAIPLELTSFSVFADTSKNTALNGVLSNENNALVVFDSQIHQSLLLASMAKTKGFDVIDLATENSLLWRNIRSIENKHYTSIVGLTKWSDFVAIKSSLQDQGKRLSAPETKVEQERSVAGTLFQWQMA